MLAPGHAADVVLQTGAKRLSGWNQRSVAARLAFQADSLACPLGVNRVHARAVMSYRRQEEQVPIHSSDSPRRWRAFMDHNYRQENKTGRREKRHAEAIRMAAVRQAARRKA
jgi:hypothetical protein